MHMSFWWDYKVDNLIFPGCNVTSQAGLFGICVLVGCLAFLFEMLKYLQAKHRQMLILIRSKQLRTICPSESATLLMAQQGVENDVKVSVGHRLFLYGSEIGLWFSVLNLGYFLMLYVMIFNGWFFVSALIGGALGYFIFGQMFMKLNLENCQIIRDTYCKLSICGADPSDKSDCSKDGESTPVMESSSPSTSDNQNIRPCHQHSHHSKVTVKVDCH